MADTNLNPITNYLNGLTTLSIGFIDAIEILFVEVFYKNHQIIQGPGQADSKVFFINKGFARSYVFDDKGNEYTLNFFNEGELIFSVNGLWHLPAAIYIEVLEDSEISYARYEDLRPIFLEYKEAAEILRLLMSQFLEQELALKLFYSKPAEKRYELYRSQKSFVFRKASLRFIASYLHMSRESLSRIINQKNR